MIESDSGYDTIRHVDNEYVELYGHTQPPVSGPDVFKKVVVPSIDKVYPIIHYVTFCILLIFKTFFIMWISCVKLLLPKKLNLL